MRGVRASQGAPGSRGAGEDWRVPQEAASLPEDHCVGRVVLGRCGNGVRQEHASWLAGATGGRGALRDT